MDKIKLLEMNKLLKELEYLESDQNFKNEIIKEIDSDFIGEVNEFLKKHPELKDLFEKKVNRKIDETIRNRHEEEFRKRNKDIHFAPSGEPIKPIFDEEGKPIVPKFDEGGQYVPPTDENGNPIKVFDKKGNPVENTKDENGKTLPPKIEDSDLVEEEAENEEPEEEITEEQAEIKKKEEVKSKKIKKVYREIVKLTHPDKVKDVRLNEIYLKATSFYDKNDLIAIYSVCNELKIAYELDEIDYELIKIKINTIKERIKFMESTFTWKWHKAENAEEKQMLVMNYIKNQIKR